MNDASAEFEVPAELLAGVAWADTALSDHTKYWSTEVVDGAHAPRSAGVMGLPERGEVRSVGRGAALAGVEEEAIVFDARQNIRGAAAILRAIADQVFGAGVLTRASDREQWLRVAARYFDAGAAGDELALEVRKTIARGLQANDDQGRTFEIASFEELSVGKLSGGPETRRFAVTGEYPSSTWVAASTANYTNASRTDADIDVVVIHTVQGSYAGAISWFQNASAGVSAHYVVRRSDGAITQMVRHEDIAWHAGNWSYNQRSIGIEHEGWVSDPNNYTPAMMQSSANLTRWLCDTLGIPKDRSHIIGHVEVPNATHVDPGGYWDWPLYMSLVNATGNQQPSSGNGTLKGVVYVGTDLNNRVARASISLSSGGASATADDSGYFELSLSPGVYTVTAAASGYSSSQVTRTITAGTETWGSVSVAPQTQPSGVYRGVVYDARVSDFSARLAGATVRLSNGDAVTTGADGAFLFSVASGAYTATAELGGWESSSTQRTVSSGQTSWGSIGLVPQGTATNRPPRLPALQSPIDGVTVVSAQPTFTIDDLGDPDGDAMTVDVEIFASDSLASGTRISSVRVAVPSGSTIISWRHPGNDLPRPARLFWRARASDGRASTPWTTVQSFWTIASGQAAVPSTDTWTVEPSIGVGTNAPPGRTVVKDPLENAVAATTRPEILAGRATDPEGDALAYQFQVAADDLFQVTAVESDLIAEQGDLTGWVVTRSLALGGRYYVRVRAADEQVFGPWSPVVAFSIDPNAATSDDRPALPQDPGGSPEIRATIATDEGGCTAVGGPSGWAPLLLVAGLLLVRARLGWAKSQVGSLRRRRSP